MENMTINVIPSLTWRWLRMNGAKVSGVPEVTEGKPAVQLPASVEESAADYGEISGIPGGMGYDMDTFVRDSGVPVRKYTVKSGVRAASPLYMNFRYEEGAGSLNAIELELQEDAELTVVMDYASPEEYQGFGGVQTKIRLYPRSTLRLVQIFRTGSGLRFFNDIGADAAEEARLEQTQLILSGGEAYLGSRTDLKGYKSSLGINIGYLLKQDARLDMNYIANHIGRKTECEINVDGVLRDRAFKLFRGTIDLRKGAKGAVGNELEDVLLMDDTVVNQTIPVILCDEEDVEGNHGATIGRIDESLLFYLQSRGMSQEEVYEMMAGARIDAVISRIPDAETKKRIYGELHGEAGEQEQPEMFSMTEE